MNTTSSLEMLGMSLFDRMHRATWDPQIVAESDRQLAAMAGFAEATPTVSPAPAATPPKSYPRENPVRKSGCRRLQFMQPPEKD